MISEVARFYGFGHLEIQEMPCDDFMAYYRCISKIRAKEMIEECRTGSFASMDGKQRKDMIKKLERQTFQQEPAKVLSMDDFMRAHE